MKKGAWYVLSLFLLIIVVAVFGIIKFSAEKASDPDISAGDAHTTEEIIIPTEEVFTTEEIDETEAPIATYVPQTQTPVQTPTPTPKPTPSPTPVPTPKPTPTPEPTPAGTKLASGSFASNTGTGLNLVVDYIAAEAGSGNATVQLKVSINSYSLTTSALYDSIKVKIGSNSYSLSSPAVNVTGNALTKTSLVTVNCPSVSKGSIPVSVTWEYRGTYSGVDLPTITASATINT